jgi:hypothetical protein
VEGGQARKRERGVALANLYFEGKSVPQNCDQAHVLLHAASMKGSKAADNDRSQVQPAITGCNPIARGFGSGSGMQSHSPWFRLWQRYGVCCRPEAPVIRLPEG